MENKLKVMTILGTRPEIIRLSEVIRRCDEYFNHILVHTGQNWDYSLSDVFFDELQLRKPAHYLDCASKDLGETLGNILSKSYHILIHERPDALLILGDTNSALSAICAKRLKIPIFHMEAGNRCWDWNVSEMVNRTIVDHISDINLPYTENSRHYLLSEGIDGKTIFVTGSPMREVLERHLEYILKSDVAERLGLESGKFFLVSAHREENVDNENNFFDLMTALNNLAEKYEIPVVYSVHPRSMKWIEHRKFKFNPLVKKLNPFGFFDYNKLQLSARCVLSDSGTLSEEAAILNFAAVLIRTSTERPEALDKGSVIIGGISSENIERAIDIAVRMRQEQKRVSQVADYADVNVSDKVVRIIQSYTHIVNKTTWMK